MATRKLYNNESLCNAHYYDIVSSPRLLNLSQGKVSAAHVCTYMLRCRK